MCCNFCPEKTKDLRKQIKQGHTRFWKIYQLNDESNDESNARSLFTIRSPWQLQTLIILKNGIVCSSRKTTKLTQNEKDSGSVMQGIHVYAQRPIYAQRPTIGFLSKSDLLVPVEVKPNNLVAMEKVNHLPSAVFTRITITKDELIKAVAERLKAYLPAWTDEEQYNRAIGVVAQHCDPTFN